VTTRDRIVIMVVLAVGAIVASWLLVVSPKRNEAASLSTQISSEQSQLDSVRSQVAAGVAAQRAFAGQYAQLARLGEAVPPTDDVPSLIYQVQSAASAAHVSFRGLQLTAGTSSPTPAPTPSPSGSSSTAASSAGSSSTTAASGSQLPPGAAVGAAGLPTEQFTFTLSGNFFHLANFFNRLNNFVISRNNRLLISGRLMTINAINLSPGATGFPQISASVSATTYIVPATDAPGTPTGGATSAGSATAPTKPQASTPGSSTAAPAATIAPGLR
jgi:type II secretory pathway pseudopilin PulG